MATMTSETPRPSVVPTSHGGIQLEWHTRGIDLEVGVAEPEQVTASYEDGIGNTAWEKNVTSDLRPLVEVVSIMSERA